MSDEENKPQIVLWIGEPPYSDTAYGTSTWFRCMGIEKFVEKVMEKHDIVGVTFSGNNLGFILNNEPGVPLQTDKEESSQS